MPLGESPISNLSGVVGMTLASQLQTTWPRPLSRLGVPSSRVLSSGVCMAALAHGSHQLQPGTAQHRTAKKPLVSAGDSASHLPGAHRNPRMGGCIPPWTKVELRYVPQPAALLVGLAYSAAPDMLRRAYAGDAASTLSMSLCTRAILTSPGCQKPQVQPILQVT